MASDTDTAKPREDQASPKPMRVPVAGSRLGRLIVVLNLAGLMVLIVGALGFNELRRGLIEARIDSLRAQGELIANVIEEGATRVDPPTLEPAIADEVLQPLFIPRALRARLFDARGNLVGDSQLSVDLVEGPLPLPPAHKRGELVMPWAHLNPGPSPKAVADARAALAAEVHNALEGRPISNRRRSDTGVNLVSVSIPIQRVQAVLGVLTLEAGDVDQVVAAQRMALLPFILIAIAVALGSSLLLNQLIAQPILRLARAADSVRLSRARAISLPDIAERDDEVGALARSLESMTSALSDRMGHIERFAADVAHEIRNPLTSIRSAVETMELLPDLGRAKLLPIVKQDVSRLDRLITDISNASRLDAELSRESPKDVDLGRLLTDIVGLYEPRPGGVEVRMAPLMDLGPHRVVGREGPLGQVFRNLIDNARSFSPPGGLVAVGLRRDRTGPARRIQVLVDDQGPGIPAENLETVFERFYTARPKGAQLGGAAFGGHSGLGLAIARQIIEAHGGAIHAENRIDADGKVLGARFVVALPEART